MPAPSRLPCRLDGVRLVVVGDALLDVYLDGHVERLAREAPVPIVRVEHRREQLGGAANAAARAAALGAQVRLVTAVGDDGAGDRLVELLAQHGVETAGVEQVAGTVTTTKHRLLAGPRIVARYDVDGDDPPPRARAALRKALLRSLADADALLVSDYGGGLVAPTVLPRARPAIVVDARDPRRWRGERIAALKANRDEARLLDGHHRLGSVAEALACAVRVLATCRTELLAITLDAEGAVIAARGEAPFHLPGRPVDSEHTVGLGDVFAAALGIALGSGADPREAATEASRAAQAVLAGANPAAHWSPQPLAAASQTA